MTAYYDDGQVVIYHADVRDMIDVGHVAAVVTSPPYNVGIPYEGVDDNLPWPEYWKLVDMVAGRQAFGHSCLTLDAPLEGS